MIFINFACCIVTFFLLEFLRHLHEASAQTTSTSACAIPNSTLRSGVWYTVDMKGFTPGFLTWTTYDETKSKEIQWFLHHEYHLDNVTSSKFQRGGEWYESTLWEFYPSKLFPGWYKMRNGRFQDSFVTWSSIDYVPTQEPNTSHYLILGKNRKEEDYLIKPVFMEKAGSVEYHQLIMRHFPRGKINWSRHNENGHFIQNHHGEGDGMKRYEKGGSFYDDILFIFTEAEVTEDWECIARSGENLAKVIQKTLVIMAIGAFLLMWKVAR